MNIHEITNINLMYDFVDVVINREHKLPTQYLEACKS
jgi:hypothetical protein